MYYSYLEEGDKCPKYPCKGKMHYPLPENCSCHISPPCSACTDIVLTCNECGWEDDSEPERAVMVCPGLSEIIHKPRKLDNTKIDYRILPHTHFTMILKGVYPEHMSQQEVKEQVKGTFGGRMVSFKDGKFEYIAYTD
jgi:hypothetical protein